MVALSSGAVDPRLIPDALPVPKGSSPNLRLIEHHSETEHRKDYFTSCWNQDMHPTPKDQAWTDSMQTCLDGYDFDNFDGAVCGAAGWYKASIHYENPHDCYHACAPCMEWFFDRNSTKGTPILPVGPPPNWDDFPSRNQARSQKHNAPSHAILSDEFLNPPYLASGVRQLPPNTLRATCLGDCDYCIDITLGGVAIRVQLAPDGGCLGYSDMAPHRAFSFPLSHLEEDERIPPFEVSKKDVSRLRSCEAFQIIRALLVDREDVEFCDNHNLDSREDKEAWLLQRDITYALIVPVLEIYRHATQTAKALLGNRHIFDLELVFRGEARGAFSWLQCFVMEEEDWCLTRGCPGCVVSHALVAEPTIRLILVACHLSSTLSNATSSLPYHPHHRATSPPLLDFWQHSLKKALDEDPFWGPDLWRTFEARAKALERGIEELVKQCINFAPLAAAAAAATANAATAEDESPPQSPKHGISNLPPVASKEQEQRDWMPSVVLGCWTTLLADAKEAKRVRPSSSAFRHPLLLRASSSS
ncbi:MAG: hypothetical protein L6R40_003177 [Gallowayella cf. fulva]|nr:MAG: hypothetical protein L6R40_003177 [Xanthomendoza cf. fulva]